MDIQTGARTRKRWPSRDQWTKAADHAVNSLISLLQAAAVYAAAVWTLATFPYLNASPDRTGWLFPAAAALVITALIVNGLLGLWQHTRRRRKAAAAKARLAPPPILLADIIARANDARTADGRQPLNVPAGLGGAAVPYSRVGVTLSALYDLPGDVQTVCFVSIAPGTAGAVVGQVTR